MDLVAGKSRTEELAVSGQGLLAISCHGGRGKRGQEKE
jgi:hypothetical protein